MALVSLTTLLAAGVPAATLQAAPARGARSKESKESGLGRSYAFVAEGDAAYERGDYEEAIAKYSAAYYVLTSQERASYAGSIPVRNAMRAYDQQVAQRVERTQLERQLAFVVEYLETVRNHPGVPNPPGPELIAELEAKCEQIKETIAAVSDAVAPSTPEDPPSSDASTDAAKEDEPPVAEPEPQTAREPTTAPPRPAPSTGETDRPPAPLAEVRRARRVGIALGASGGVVLGVGAGILSGWWTVRKQAPELADMEPGYEEGSPHRVTYLQREEDRARRYLISGAVLMGAGAVLGTTGVIISLRARRRSRELSVVPQLDLTSAGLHLRGRF